MSKRAVLYARVSYYDRGNEARNLEGQIEDGQRYCADRDYRIVAELAEDDRGASGASFELPKLNQALDMARAGEFDVFVTRELDRFARSLAKQLVTEGELKRCGVEVEYILGEYPDTPEGRLNKHIRATIAEFEREKITQRMTRGRRLKVKAGHVMMHGRPPLGYQVAEVDGKTVLVICDEEAKIVVLIFTWYTEGDGENGPMSLSTIARKLISMGIPTPADIRGYMKKRGWGEWVVATVGNILKNETYAGTWCYGGNPQLAVEVPAIISREVWEKAQERRRTNQEMAKRNTKHEYLVGRRVACAECGSRMAGCPKRNRRKQYLYYRCQSKYPLIRECTMTTYFRADQVDAATWSWVKELLLDPDTLRHNLKEKQAEQKKASRPLHDRLAVMNDLLADKRKQRERLLDLYQSGALLKDALVDRLNRLETEITALEKEQVDIDLLDVQVTLAIEEGQKIAYVKCLIDERELSIESTSS
jgi:site-specific DNA recombinase